jgi:hypothetical protein
MLSGSRALASARSARPDRLPDLGEHPIQNRPVEVCLGAKKWPGVPRDTPAAA